MIRLSLKIYSLFAAHFMCFVLLFFMALASPTGTSKGFWVYIPKHHCTSDSCVSLPPGPCRYEIDKRGRMKFIFCDPRRYVE